MHYPYSPPRLDWHSLRAFTRWFRPGEADTGGTLLCIANFPSGTGYAWDFIESLYAGVADRLSARGVVTFVGYPELVIPPRALHGSAAREVKLPFDLNNAAGIRRVIRFVLQNRVQTLYLTDRPTWHPVYAMLRGAGVKRVVVHDHTSGVRSNPQGIRRWAKTASRRIPGFMADCVIGISDYVVNRIATVDLVPAQRLHRVWNSIPIPTPSPHAHHDLRTAFGLDAARPVVVCACRTTPEKGVFHLLRAFDSLLARGLPGPRPALVYMGEGPAMPELRALHERLASREDILLVGYRADASALIAGATCCVVPSLWQEGFGLAALEPQAHGIPVVASRVGGIPEVVVHNTTGLLVSPGNEEELEEAMRRLLLNPVEASRMGCNGRTRVITHFARGAAVDRLAELISGSAGEA